MKQTPSYTSEFFLSQSNNSLILWDMTGSSEYSFQFADILLLIWFVYSVSSGMIIITSNRV